MSRHRRVQDLASRWTRRWRVSTPIPAIACISKCRTIRHAMIAPSCLKAEHRSARRWNQRPVPDRRGTGLEGRKPRRPMLTSTKKGTTIQSVVHDA